MKFNRDDFNFFYRYCVALTKDESMAFDLLQTTFEKWLRKNLHSKVTYPKQYFLRMIKHQFLDDLKKENYILFEEFEEEATAAEIGPNPLEKTLITKDELKRALRVLNSDERELIFLWGMGDYTTQEIADYLDVPKGTILARLFRLKEKVKKTFSKEEKREGL